MCKWELHQRSKYTGAWSEQDHHYWQLTTSIWLSATQWHTYRKLVCWQDRQRADKFTAFPWKPCLNEWRCETTYSRQIQTTYTFTAIDHLRPCFTIVLFSYRMNIRYPLYLHWIMHDLAHICSSVLCEICWDLWNTFELNGHSASKCYNLSQSVFVFTYISCNHFCVSVVFISLSMRCKNCCWKYLLLIGG